MLRALMQTAARIRAFFRRDDLDRDFADELDAHLAMLTDDYVRRGMTLEQARRAAIIRVGAPVSLREQHRAARGLPGLEGIAQDVRFACRLIARDRWFSAAIAAALALTVPLQNAVELALEYVHKAIASAPGLGSGHGPLNHFA